jgi:hypothetical protein
MSIAARDWALRQDLKPVPKFVLVVLADAANDQGVCWPRVSTIARKVGVTSRTVQRAIQLLIRRELITAEQRYRSDGSCSSNLYRLSLEGGDRLSPAPDCGDTAPDTRVIPGTTIGTIREPPQPPASEIDTADRGGGAASDLVYPKDLLPAERAEAEAMLAALQAPLNQQVLDEWAGIMAAGAIRVSPLGCLRALIKRAQAGSFTPERALRVAQARKARQRIEAAQAQVKLTMSGPIDEGNPIVQRLMTIAQRKCRR